MLRTIDLRGERGDPASGLPRAAAGVVTEARDTVARIVADVRAEGDVAVRRHSRLLDGWEGPYDVDESTRKAALEDLDAGVRDALSGAAAQIRWFHERAKPRSWTETREGASVGVRYRPLRRVGVYVPGGRGAYPSTVLMTVLPARIAGVDEVVVCTPPNAEGAVEDVILAAAELAGADRVLRIGGAQGIAAMATGTDGVPRCDKVVGPGNMYVAEAKQQVAAAGLCGVDGFAGPTEIAIIADDTAHPLLLAADLVAQAEHDPLASCLLVTPSPELAERVLQALAAEVSATRHRERVEAALEGQGGVVLVDDLEHAVAVVDAYAPEHLEVHTADAPAVAERVRAAGAVFVGASTPVSLGDYAAGPNHTLPTAGTARFNGGLRTDDFMVPVNWVQYEREALARLAPVVTALAAVEDLPAHARAVAVRRAVDAERG